MRSRVALLAGILSVLAAFAIPAQAQYTSRMISGIVPGQVSSDSGTADLDGDGQLEIIVADPTAGSTGAYIYELMTGNWDWDTPCGSAIVFIHIVPSLTSGRPVALVQTEGGQTFVIQSDGLASAPPPEDPAPIAPGLRTYPNPSPSGTTIEFSSPRRGRVDISLYDVSGRCVRRIADTTVDAGKHSLSWDGRDDQGSKVGPGVYFFSLSIDGEIVEAHKTVTVR
jgi:hypothetical protein